MTTGELIRINWAQRLGYLFMNRSGGTRWWRGDCHRCGCPQRFIAERVLWLPRADNPLDGGKWFHAACFPL